MADTETSVHWWPGDCKLTKDWTQWNKGAFNTGVAGPFLKYVTEIGVLPYHTGCIYQILIASFPDQLVKAEMSLPAIQTSSHTISNSVSIIDNTPSVNGPLAHNGSTTTTTSHQANYCSLPTKKTTSIPPQGVRKRKHASKLRPIHYSEGMDSKEDDPSSFSGDGSSSRGFGSNDVPAQVK
jgi:hypothetical protein